MVEKAAPRSRFLKGISNTLNQLVEDEITDLVVTMASAVPYALVMRHLSRSRYSGQRPVNFLIYDPSLHPKSNRPHKYNRNRSLLHEQQLQRLNTYFKNRPKSRVGVFDESGYRMSGQSIRLTQEQIRGICHQSVKRYTIGRRGLLASRNAESTHGKLFMREEEFISDAANHRREFLVRDLKLNIRRGTRGQFASLAEDLRIAYVEFRGCWRAVGNSAKIMMAGYNRIAEEILRLPN